MAAGALRVNWAWSNQPATAHSPIPSEAYKAPDTGVSPRAAGGLGLSILRQATEALQKVWDLRPQGPVYGELRGAPAVYPESLSPSEVAEPRAQGSPCEEVTFTKLAIHLAFQEDCQEALLHRFNQQWM